jgi:hypothetical protein
MASKAQDMGIWREASLLFAFGLSLNYLLLMVDNTPRFFFGDSASYLATRLEGYLPHERSWTYGVALEWIMARTGSLSSVIMLQGALQTLGLAAIGAAMTRETGIAWMGAVFVAFGLLDPLSFYYQRAILTDAPAASLFLLSLFFLYRLLDGKPLLRKGTVADVASLALCAAAAVSLRSAYVPVLIGLCIICFAAAALAAIRRRSGASTGVPSTSLAAVLAIVCGLITVPVVNNAVNPTQGYSFNRGAGAYLMGIIAPAIRPSMLEAEGMSVDDTTFRQLDLGNMTLRNAQTYAEGRLVHALRRQMGDLPIPQEEDRFRRLVRRVVWENPVGLAQIFWQQLMASFNPRTYLSDPLIALELNDATFTQGFLDEFVHPLVWQKIDKDLPAQKTVARSLLIHTAPLIWLQYLVAIMAPLGLLISVLRRSVLFSLLAFAACGYALSTVLFSADTIARYFVVLGPLALALALLCIAAVIASHKFGGVTPAKRNFSNG